jgi:WD40 repeat protein
MYSEERGGYISPDLTLLADHICAQGIREMAWQRSPRSILWVVMGNGELASLTLDRNHNIQAWARHPMDGTVDSVAVIPGADEDVVYLVVKHEISGAPVKYIERMKPIKRPADEKDYFFVDSGMTFDYSGYTATIGGEGLTKLPDASTLPTGIGRACAFSSEGALYLAIAHHSSPFITIYKRANESFTKLANPTTLPTGDGIGVAFSPDTVYLAVAHTANPVVTIYKRSGDTFEKLADPADLPAGVGCSAAFSPDSVYLAVGHTSWPYVTIYKRSGDTFTKLANPVTLPTGYGYGLAFSADGVYLAVAHATLPYVTIYKRSGDTFEKLADPADLPAGISNGIAFSPDCTYLGVAHYTTPFITIYKRDVDTFTKLANPAELPTEEGKACAFSADGSRLAVAHVDSPFITIYDRLEDTFTKATDPIPVPTGIGRGCVFSPEDMHLVVAHSTSPFVTVYSSQAATQSEPITLRISSHTFPSDGDMVDSFVRITGVVGMTELNGNAYMLKLLGPLTFELYETDGVTPVDGTDFGVYESGGVGVKVMNTLDGLDHLEGKYVMAYADGEALVKETMGVSGYLVTGGVITLDVYASKIHVGLPYTGKLWTQRLGGFSPVRIPEATLLLYKSRGGKIGADANSLKNIRYASDTLLTGPQEVRIGGAFSREGSIMIVQDQPLPMTVLGIVAEIVAGE